RLWDLTFFLASPFTGRRALLQSPGLSKAYRPSTALQPAPGRRVVGEIPDLQKLFVWWRDIPGLRQPPGELPCAAKRCLTPTGDEKCLVPVRLPTIASLPRSVYSARPGIQTPSSLRAIVQAIRKQPTLEQPSNGARLNQLSKSSATLSTQTRTVSGA